MRGHTVAITIISIVLAFLVGFVGYLFVQNQKLSNSVAGISPTPGVAANPTAVLGTDSPDVIETNSGSSTISSTSSLMQPTIIIESASVIPQADKDQITKRVINPFVDYYKEQSGAGALVSLKISTNTNPSKTTYPYKADAIFDSGVNSGFLISKTSGVIDWWLPECQKSCKFSDSFKAKYPEIVAKSP